MFILGAFIAPACNSLDNFPPVPSYMKDTYKKATNGDMKAQTEIGNYFYEYGVSSEEKEAACYFWKLAADQGDPEAQTNLGRSYSMGYGVEQDYVLMDYWERKAAEQGYGRAFNNIAASYMNRTIPTKSDYFEEMYKYYKQAVDLGYTGSYYWLGQCYEYGVGVPADFKSATEMYLASAEAGDKYGQFAIGIMYYNGRGVIKDEDLAAYWWEQAAKQGYEVAKNNVAAIRYQNQQKQKKENLERRIISDDIYGDPHFNWVALKRAVIYNYKDGYGDGKQDISKTISPIFQNYIESTLRSTRYVDFETFHDKLMDELNICSKYRYVDFKDETFPGFKSIYYISAYNQRIEAYYAGLNDVEILTDDKIWETYLTRIDNYMSLIRPIENPDKPEITKYINKLRKEERLLNKNATRISSPNGRYQAYITSDISTDILNEIILGNSIESEFIYHNGLCLIENDSIKSLYYPNRQRLHYKLRECITNIAWGLDSDILYFTNGGGEGMANYSVYACSIKTKAITEIAPGYLNRVIPDGEYKGYIEVYKPSYMQESRWCWYKAAISPDEKNEIKLSEPTIDFPRELL